MKKILEINNLIVSIYFDENCALKSLPLVLFNLYDEDGDDIWNLARDLNTNEFIFVTISNINWNDDMTPWHMDKLFSSGDDYAGKADSYLNVLCNEVLPLVNDFIEKDLLKKVSFYSIGGYSLAGLFSIYSIFKTSCFSRFISCSGSLWYPNFVGFVKEHLLDNLPKRVYFSIGSREYKSKNKLMANVLNCTLDLKDYFDKNGVETIFEENEGNHFQDVSYRIAKSIYSILK